MTFEFEFDSLKVNKDKVQVDSLVLSPYNNTLRRGGGDFGGLRLSPSLPNRGSGAGEAGAVGRGISRSVEWPGSRPRPNLRSTGRSKRPSRRLCPLLPNGGSGAARVVPMDGEFRDLQVVGVASEFERPFEREIEKTDVGDVKTGRLSPPERRIVRRRD